MNLFFFSSLEMILIALLFSPIDLLPEHQEHIDNVSYFNNLCIIELLFYFYALLCFFIMCDWIWLEIKMICTNECELPTLAGNEEKCYQLSSPRGDNLQPWSLHAALHIVYHPSYVWFYSRRLSHWQVPLKCASKYVYHYRESCNIIECQIGDCFFFKF